MVNNSNFPELFLAKQNLHLTKLNCRNWNSRSRR